MSQPEISVVMSCYNAEATIVRAITSILNQSFSNFEFIIIDDGSIDNSRVIMSEFSKRDERINCIYNKKNIGLAASLNKGIQNAKSQIIARMDADDESVKSRFEIQYDYLKQHEYIDILGSGVIFRNATGELKGTQLLPEKHEEIVKRIFRKSLLYHPTIMFKKSVFEKYGGYDPLLFWAEDADFWYRIYDRVVFGNIPEPLLYYTVKKRLSIKNASTNFRVKWVNLKRRGLEKKYVLRLIYDFFLLGSKVIRHRL